MPKTVHSSRFRLLPKLRSVHSLSLSKKNQANHINRLIFLFVCFSASQSVCSNQIPNCQECNHFNCTKCSNSFYYKTTSTDPMNLVTLCVEKVNCVDDYYSTSADFICRSNPTPPDKLICRLTFIVRLLCWLRLVPLFQAEPTNHSPVQTSMWPKKKIVCDLISFLFFVEITLTECLYKCKSCVGEEECVSCAQNYYFYNKKCYLREDCPKYTVAQISSGSQVSALRCLSNVISFIRTTNNAQFALCFQLFRVKTMSISSFSCAYATSITRFACGDRRAQNAIKSSRTV